MEFKGRINRVLPIQSGTTEKGPWQRQEFVFEYYENQNDRWSDKVLLSVMNDRIKEYDLHEGDEVLIGFGHNIREWQGRIFNEVRIYKFEKVKGVAVVQQQTGLEQGDQPSGQAQQQTAPQAAIEQPKQGEDDLPF